MIAAFRKERVARNEDGGFQHAPFEGPAAIGEWAAARKIDVAVRHLYQGDPLPELSEFDMLTVMGGPMSANDEADWLGSRLRLRGPGKRRALRAHLTHLLDNFVSFQPS